MEFSLSRSPAPIYYHEVVVADVPSPKWNEGRIHLMISDQNTTRRFFDLRKRLQMVGAGESRRHCHHRCFTKNTLEVTPVVLAFFMSWSKRSQRLAPLFSALARGFPDVKFISVNVIHEQKIEYVRVIFSSK